MSEDGVDLMLKMLRSIQQDVADIRRELVSQGSRLAAIEDLMVEVAK